MQIVNLAEGKKWVDEHALSDLNPKFLDKEFQYKAIYPIPADSGIKTNLARRILSYIPPNKKGCFWINGYGIWPSSQNMELFDAYRRSLGEHRPLHEAPYHLFSSLTEDLKILECLMDLSLYFVWDAILVESPLEVIINISHDEMFTIYSRSKERFVLLEKFFENKANA